LAGRTYTTHFPLAESPISENGNWISGGVLGVDWGDVLTTPGLAMGRDGPVDFSDPVALLTGAWGPDQTAEATVYSVRPTTACNQEVELRLRSCLSAHKCTGYEVLFRCMKTPGAYMEVVRWNGRVADFTYLSRNKGPQYGVANGDVIKATIIGNVISVYVNGTLLATVEDNAFAAGSPGIGFNFGCGETYGDFGLTSFMATDGLA
jgi:hypothetical protein